ncbi:26S proteasome regulatory subunit 4 [Chionoecetes opilio]|uniref:26S proteasome regulatory subunit 4 n=1 Tax=Chionoecetes opilio TaxID=41210 RepID=A0A8J8W9C4_CHIOP|nr:26S proteasome regulatory subunit 4 [Chionoecetes opilio]
MLKLERIKDYLLMEEEFIRNQETLRPQEEKQEEERSKVDDLRGTPMSVGTLEEIIDDNHAIVSTSVGSEHYVSILSFVDKDQLEPGCSVLLNHKVSWDTHWLTCCFGCCSYCFVVVVRYMYYDKNCSVLNHKVRRDTHWLTC